jgi:hypothetical protein
MLQDTLKRIQARSAAKSCRVLHANPYPFGVDMQSDKKRKQERLFVISARPGKTSVFNSQLRSFKGSGKSESSPASKGDPRD